MKKVIFFCLSLLMLCMGSNIYAQSNFSKPKLQLSATSAEITQRCHTMENFDIRLQNDPAYRKSHEEYIRNFVKPNIDTYKAIACTGANTINVPVAFHFDNSFSCANATCMLTEINDAINTLNNDFGDNTSSPNAANCPAAYPDISTGTCITFYLAAPPACSGLDVTCEGAITIGQFGGGYSAPGGSGAGACWDDYLNIFVQSAQSGNLGVADQIPGYLNAAGPGEGVSLGAPYFGGVGGACSPFDTDGTFGMGKTLAHEIGHYLGLPHIWGDVNGGGCGGDDGFADTPNQSTQYFGCPGGCVASGCGGNQQTANIMNYTNDACMDLFTEDQAATMNFYANQFFSGLSIPAASPTEIYTCTGNTCNVVCPGAVTAPYSGSEDLCAALGTYTLPTDFSSVGVDNVTSATFTWSTGNYMSVGGTEITGTTYTLNNPPTCAPVTEILYLNTGCTDNSIQEINAGTITLIIYPDPTQLAVADVVTFTDGVCDEPTWTSDCASFVTVTQNGGPTFPVTTGAGTVDYDVTVAYPVDCCSVPGGDIILTGTIGATTLNAANASQTCVNGTNPAVWEIPFTVPTAQNATTINPTGLGSITEVCLDITLNNTDAVNLTLDSPDCGGYEWEELWLGTAFTGGANTGPITVCFTPSTANGQFDGTFDGDDGTNGSFNTCDVNSNQWVLYIADFNCYLNGATGGSINSATLSFNDGNEPGQPGLCDFTATAAYDCAATACANVDLDILFDGFPGQSSWDIVDDATGAVVASGGTYSSQPGSSTLTTPSCLFDGCYTLNFYDAIGNGMCPFQSTTASVATFITPGTLITSGSIVATLGAVVTPGLCGNYTLTDATGSILASGGGGGFSTQSNQFCLNNGLAPLWHDDNDSEYMRQTESARLDVLPNLVKDNLSLYYSVETTDAVQINIVDINGQIIQQHTQRNAQQMQLNVNDLQSGIYFVQLLVNDTIIVKKFIKY